MEIFHGLGSSWMSSIGQTMHQSCKKRRTPEISGRNRIKSDTEVQSLVTVFPRWFTTTSNCKRLMQLAFYLRRACNPKERWRYDTILKHLYWPPLAYHAYKPVAIFSQTRKTLKRQLTNKSYNGFHRPRSWGLWPSSWWELLQRQMTGASLW